VEGKMADIVTQLQDQVTSSVFLLPLCRGPPPLNPT